MMPRKNPPVSPPKRYPQPNCDNKRRYESEEAARRVKEHQELLDMSLHLRVYKCPIPGCGGWHLTRK